METTIKLNHVRILLAFIIIILVHILILKSSVKAANNEGMKNELREKIQKDDSVNNNRQIIIMDNGHLFKGNLPVNIDSLTSAVTENLKVIEEDNKLIIKWKDGENIIDLSQLDSLKVYLDNFQMPAIPDLPDIPNPPDLGKLDSAFKQLDMKLKFDEKQVQQKIDSAMKILEKKLEEMEIKMKEFTEE